MCVSLFRFKVTDISGDDFDKDLLFGFREGIDFFESLKEFLNVFQDVYITLQTKYSLPLGSSFRDYFSHSLGIAGVIGKPRRKAVVKNVAPSVAITPTHPDRDRDGILDTADICPDVPGLKQFSGCPDRDKDGVEDRLDKCPDVPGFIQYRGCPIHDYSEGVTGIQWNVYGKVREREIETLKAAVNKCHPFGQAFFKI